MNPGDLEARCDAWRQLCYKHEQTIVDLRYQLVCANSGFKECLDFMQSIKGLNSHPQWLELQELIKKYTAGAE